MPDYYNNDATALHVDQFLTNISQAYTNEMYVGERVFPTQSVDNRSDLYVIYGTEAFKGFKDGRAPGTEALEVKQSITRGTYLATEHAVKTMVTAEAVRYADSPLTPEIDATIFVTEIVRNQREFAQLAVASDPTQMTQNIALSGTTLWSAYGTSTPLTVIRGGRQAVRSGVHREANRMLLSYNVALTLADHPSMKDLLKYTDPNMVGAGGLPSVIRGLSIDVSGVDQDSTGLFAATPSFSPAFNNAALIYYQEANAGLRSTLSVGRTLEAPDAVTGNRGAQIRKWWDDAKKVTWIESADTYAVKVFAPLGAYLIAPAI